MGWCFHGYWPDMTPLSDVITLPSLPIKSAEKGSEVLWKLYEKFPSIQNEYKDVHVASALGEQSVLPNHDEEAGQNHGGYQRPEDQGCRRTSHRTDEGTWSHSNPYPHAGYLPVHG